MSRRQRHLAVELSGAALRELLPWLARLADWMDPSDTATEAWGPRELTVPAAWVEMEAGK
jgi:hypothetical protein